MNHFGVCDMIDLTSPMPPKLPVQNNPKQEEAKNRVRKRISLIDLTNDSTLDHSITNDIETILTRFSCSICQQPISVVQGFVTLCGHIYCSQCKEIIVSAHKCPKCNNEVTESDLVKLFI